MIYRNLSITDLRGIKGFEEALAQSLEGNSESLHKLLWLLGVDTKDHVVEVMLTEHVNAKQQKVNDVYFLGVERSDKEWLKSGFASDEARFASSDSSIQKDLANMSKRVASDHGFKEACFE